MAVVARAPSRLLVVEGDDDKHVALHIAMKDELDISPCDVVAKNGMREVIKSITNEIKVPERSQIRGD